MERSFFARNDSNSANNPALNLTKAPATELTFIDQAPDGSPGDLVLEQNGGAPDPDTVVQIGTTTYSFTFELAGTLPTAKKDGAGQVPDQFEGDAVYIVTVIDYPTPGDTSRFAFLPDSGATEAEMNAFGNGAIDVQGATTTPPPSPVCFAAGTLIATPGRDRPVEDLGPGDLVLTADGSSRAIQWAGATPYAWPGADDRHKPVLIRAGALAGGLPRRDLIVSPQHRLLIEGAAPRQRFGHAAMLAPAIGLTGLPGIRRMRGCRSVTYHHLLLDRHNVLLAEGLPAESLYPGPEALKSLGARTRALLFRPGQDAAAYGPPCAPLLTRRDAQSLAADLRADLRADVRDAPALAA